MSKSRRKQLTAQNDELCSIYVRRRDGPMCVFGCGRLVQCWFHFIKRSRSLRTRWDYENNIVGSCMPCNGYMEHNEAPFWAWYIKKRGADKMIELEANSHGICKLSIQDLENIRDDIKSKINLLTQKQ